MIKQLLMSGTKKLSRKWKSGDKILDTHVGSASSLIAAERAGLQYVGFEKDEYYYEVSQKRIKEEGVRDETD